MLHADSPAPAPHIMCLAASEVGEVTLCPHSGAIVLHLQYLSLRLDAAAFECLGLLLGHAQARLDHHKQVATRLCEGTQEWSEPVRTGAPRIERGNGKPVACVARSQPRSPSLREAKR